MFGRFKKNNNKLLKFEMLGFTEKALQSFDYFLCYTLKYKDYDTEKITPGTFRFDYTDDSFYVNFKNDTDINRAMEVASYFSHNKDKFYRPTIN